MADNQYVVENNSRKIAFLRPHNNTSIQIRLEPGDVYRVYNLDDNDITYYRQLVSMGLHLVKYEQYLRAKGTEEELEEYLEEKKEKQEEQEEVVEDIEEKQEEIVGEKEEDEQDEKRLKQIEDDDEEKQEETEENKYSDLTDEKLMVMDEEEVRDIAKELEIGNYWNKKLDNLSKDILSVVKDN